MTLERFKSIFGMGRRRGEEDDEAGLALLLPHTNPSSPQGDERQWSRGPPVVPLEKSYSRWQNLAQPPSTERGRPQSGSAGAWSGTRWPLPMESRAPIPGRPMAVAGPDTLSRRLLNRLASPFRYGTFFKENQNCPVSKFRLMAGASILALQSFILKSDLAGLQAFLESDGVQVDEADDEGWTGLLMAVHCGSVEMAQALLEHGADVNKPDSGGCSPLLAAAMQADEALCSLLLQFGAAVNVRDSDNWTPLVVASYLGRFNLIQLLLEAGAEVNTRGHLNCTALVWAAGRGATDIVHVLLERGSKTEIADKFGTTPLIWASRAGHNSTVELLLQYGARVESTGMYSWSALALAAKGNYTDIVSLLLRVPQNVNVTDENGQSPLSLACKEGHTSIVQQLLAAGAYVNLPDRAGDTNLIHAAKGGHAQIVEILLKKFAEINTKGKDGKTALFWAVEKDHAAIVKILLAYKADVELASEEGMTPLIRAVRNRNVGIVQLLLDKRARLAVTDKCGNSALHIAMRARSKTIVELLLRNPKHSQLLYKPNKSGETPYNIDLASQKPILGQLFGARKLNTNEDSESMLGYDLYGSALADILSEPSLSMPITVGLYAKWGSGKSFLLRRLRGELESFMKGCWALGPTSLATSGGLPYSLSFFLFCLHLAGLGGLVTWLAAFGATRREFWSLLLASIAVFFLSYGAVFCVQHVAMRVSWGPMQRLYNRLCSWFGELELIVSVLFFVPAGEKYLARADRARPLRLFFSDQTKVSSAVCGGENTVVQMIGSLYDSIEQEYGSLATRLFRALQPRPARSSAARRLRTLCCCPTILIYLTAFGLCIAIVVLSVICGLGIKESPYNDEYPLSPNTTLDKEAALYSPVDQTLWYVLISVCVLLLVLLTSNLHVLGHVVGALMFSQRRHLQRAIANQALVQSEGYLQAVKKEVLLLQSMLQCLDSFTGSQSRVIVIVDGLDSAEQRKVLTVLETVHTLFCEPGAPFIVLLAVDPHIIAKAIEANLSSSSSCAATAWIGGQAYLRNMVHLPFFLQNAGLRKIRTAQQLAAKQQRNSAATAGEDSSWLEQLPPSSPLSGRNVSIDSLSDSRLNLLNRKGMLSPLSPSASYGNQLEARGGTSAVGPLELNRMFLTDDYFSDVNPRSMRRLMNVIYVMGRLLKAFNIDFNWHHLATWTNITEQWPLRTTWIVFYTEHCQETLDDSLPLKMVYDKVKKILGERQEADRQLLEMDRDENKLDAFLNVHKTSLKVCDMKIFLPFTINLDPYLKKLVKEEMLTIEAEADKAKNANPPQATAMSSCLTKAPDKPDVHVWTRHIPPTFQRRKLSDLSVDNVCDLLVAASASVHEDDITAAVVGIAAVRANSISGRVLSACDLTELRSVLGLNFGEWNLLRMSVLSMRELEDRGLIESSEDTDSEPRVEASASKTRNVPTITNSGPLRRRDSVEKQIELEAEAVSGLLARINETAREDIQQMESVKAALDGTRGVGSFTAVSTADDENEDNNLDNLFQFENDMGQDQGLAAEQADRETEGEEEVSQLIYPTRSVPDMEDRADVTGVRTAHLDTRRTSGGSGIFMDVERTGSLRHRGSSSGFAARAIHFDTANERRSSGPISQRLGRGADEGGNGGDPFAWLGASKSSEKGQARRKRSKSLGLKEDDVPEDISFSDHMLKDQVSGSRSTLSGSRVSLAREGRSTWRKMRWKLNSKLRAPYEETSSHSSDTDE